MYYGKRIGDFSSMRHLKCPSAHYLDREDFVLQQAAYFQGRWFMSGGGFSNFSPFFTGPSLSHYDVDWCIYTVDSACLLLHTVFRAFKY